MLKIKFTEDQKKFLEKVYKLIGFSEGEIPQIVEELSKIYMNSSEIDNLIYSIDSFKESSYEAEQEMADELIAFLEEEKRKISPRNSVDLSKMETDNFSC